MATIQFELERLYDLVREVQDERDQIRMEREQVQAELEEVRKQNTMMQESVKKAEHESYILSHQLESQGILYRTTYDYLKNSRKENKELERQLDVLTDGTIKYKLLVDPDDLEEYNYEGKHYLRDVLTDAIYSKRGRLVGYIDEESNKLVQIFQTTQERSMKRTNNIQNFD